MSLVKEIRLSQNICIQPMQGFFAELSQPIEGMAPCIFDFALLHRARSDGFKNWFLKPIHNYMIHFQTLHVSKGPLQSNHKNCNCF